METATVPDEELAAKARRELLAQVYMLILADDWLDAEYVETAESEADEAVVAEKETTP